MNESPADLLNALSALPDSLGADTLYFGAAALLIICALILLFSALRMFRKDDQVKIGSTISIIHALMRKGVVLDLAQSADHDTMARFLITSISKNTLKGEILEKPEHVHKGLNGPVVFFFPPLPLGANRLNALSAQLIFDETEPDILTLKGPFEPLREKPRRKQPRKRVVFQQFVRVKLWVAERSTPDINFVAASPHVSVNSYTPDDHSESANQVINISRGGLALSIHGRTLPPSCAVGAPVVLNLFMYNVESKEFQPYWYAGTVRNTSPERRGFTRVGIQFKQVGMLNSTEEFLIWSPLAE